jgi:hypothetical protein
MIRVSFVVLEAKSEDKDPLDGKEQPVGMLNHRIRFVILPMAIYIIFKFRAWKSKRHYYFPTYQSLKHVEP